MNKASEAIDVFSVLFMATAFSVFSFSALNYKQLFWYEWLLYSRVSMAVLGLFIVLCYKKFNFSNVSFHIYFLFCIFTQASHGVLEGANNTDFQNFTGLIFILACFTVVNDFIVWLKTYFILFAIGMYLPIFLKEAHLNSDLFLILDNFSLIIAGTILGLGVAITVSEKNKNFKRYVAAQKKNLETAERLAHDIRSPVAALSVLVDEANIKDEVLSDLIRESIKRIEVISENSLEDFKLQTRNCNPLDVLLSLEKLKKVEYSKDNSRLSFDLCSNRNCILNISNHDLYRLVSNLINNAVESSDKPVVLVESEIVDQSTYAIRVIDNGKGIPDNIYKQLFIKKISTKVNGNGLGIYYARLEIEKIGGKLEIITKDGMGTKVEIRLPII